MPNILFLHGNVKVGVCNKHKSKGFVDQLCKNCGTTYSPTKLLYPVKHKNYNLDPFIAQEWEILQKYLKIAYEVTIFGYGSPQTDIEAKNLMLEVWKNNPTRELANISIIDIKTRESIEELWHPYIDNLHNNIFNNIFDSHLFHFPRRSCDALAMATLELDPWHENKYPNFTSLEQLKRWILPLIEEEKHDKFSGNPLERP
jgi:hypothetical protein